MKLKIIEAGLTAILAIMLVLMPITPVVTEVIPIAGLEIKIRR